MGLTDTMVYIADGTITTLTNVQLVPRIGDHVRINSKLFKVSNVVWEAKNGSGFNIEVHFDRYGSD